MTHTLQATSIPTRILTRNTMVISQVPYDGGYRQILEAAHRTFDPEIFFMTPDMLNPILPPHLLHTVPPHTSYIPALGWLSRFEVVL